MPEPRRHTLLAGGGSGGHVFPALAVGAALAARGWRVSYTGSATGIEARLAAARGIPFHALPARPVVGRGAFGKARALMLLAVSAWRAAWLMRRIRVDVVVATGGYAAAPAILGGFLARRPVLLVEPNAQAGVANRHLSRFAREAALAYPETAASLRCPARVTGVPVRSEFFEPAASTGEASIGGESPAVPRLLVLGGSQGAAQLNELVPLALARLPAATAQERRLRVLHQCGPRHVVATEAAYGAVALPGIEVTVVPFLEDMPAAMHGSALAISRAGAITLAELCAAGLPALLAPLALAGGHQGDNAAALAAAGAARVLEGDVDALGLAGHLSALLDGPDAHARRAAMAAAARALAHRDAAQAIAARAAELAEAA